MPRWATRMNGVLWAIAATATLGACTATDAAPPSASKAAENPAVELPRDAGGDEPLPGVVRIASVERRRLVTDGVVTYRVDNMRDTALHDLTWGVSAPTADRLGSAEWTPVPSVGPGERVRVEFDISNVAPGVVRSSPFVIWGRRDLK